MNRKIVTLVVVGAALASVAVWAEPGMRGRSGFGACPGGQCPQPGGFGMRGQGPGGPGGMERGEILKRVLENPEIAKKAGVTEEQIKKIKDGQLAFEKKAIGLRAEAETAKLELREQMEAAKQDRDAIGKAFDAVAAKEAALRKAEMFRMLDVKDALGEETIGKIKGMVREHLAQRMQQGGFGGAPLLQRRMGAPQQPGDAPNNVTRPWLRGQQPGQPQGQPPAEAPRPPRS